MLDKEWLKNVLAKCQEYGYRTTPIFPKDYEVDGFKMPLRKFRDGQDYKKLGQYKDAVAIGLVLEGVVLLDYDGNKGDPMPVDDLEVELDFDLVGMPTPFQVNDEGDSIHWLFNVEGDHDLKAHDDGITWPHIDIKTGNQLVHLKPHKTLNLAPREKLETCPDRLIEILSSNVAVESVDDDMGLMEAVLQNEKADLSDDEVMFYLNKLPADYINERDHWLSVGMGLNHQYRNDLEKGWEIFDEWSKAGDNYDEQSNRASWESFGKRSTGRVATFASVIKAAGGKGVMDEKVLTDLVTQVEAVDGLGQLESLYVKVADAHLKPAQLDSLIAKLCKAYELVTGVKTSKVAMTKEVRAAKTETRAGDFVDEYVFVTSDNKFIHRTTKETMVKDAFNMSHGHETPTDDEGRPLAAHQYAQGRIEVVHRSMYLPCADAVFNRNGVKYLNEYRPNPMVSVEPHSGVVDKVLAHIEHILENEREREIFINYLAHTVQYAGKKIQWCILLQGVQGDGKSFFAEMMQHILSFENVNILNPQTLESSSFTGWAVGQCMTFIEEMKVNGAAKYDIINHMKPYITNDTIEVMRKREDPYTAVNTTNYMAFTNFKGALPIDESDRRYCVLASRWQTKSAIEGFNNSHPNYYPDLYQSMREGAAELKYWLENHTIPEWFINTKRAPDTEAKIGMIDQSRTPAFHLVNEALEDYEEVVFEDGDLNLTALQGVVSDVFAEPKFKEFPKTSQLSHILSDLGYEKIGRRRSKNDPSGSLQTFYKRVG